jgi:UDP-glucose 4-epimerase
MADKRAVLVTGGAGYIGSHAALRLLREGWTVVVLDSLLRGNARAVDAVRAAAGDKGTNLHFQKGDVEDRALVEKLLREHKCENVLHFAGLAYVPESVLKPLEYYRENVSKGIVFVQACAGAGVKRFVLSSSCTTYGEPEQMPIRETTEQRPVNPYGTSKWMLERVLSHHAAIANVAAPAFGAAFLRYFNVAGADRGGALGEHHEPETHIIPIILQCLLGRRPESGNTFSIAGEDWPTPDGTCVRDYIHVDDVVDAHVRVLEALQPGQVRAYNLGIGKGLSVREVVAAAERVTGLKLKTTIGPRRPGDPATLYADAGLIERELGWRAQVRDVETMIDTAWRWFKAHPRGYDS